LRFGYDHDPEVTEGETPVLTSPADYDCDVSDPTSLWLNDCDATKKTCAGFDYWGGHNECGKDNKFYRTFSQENMHPGTNKVVFTGTIWSIDSWDNEELIITMVDEDGDVMAEKSITVSNGNSQPGSTTVDCPGDGPG
jgi:hypothetical protein